MNDSISDEMLKESIDRLVGYQNALISQLRAVIGDQYFDRSGNLVSTAPGFRSHVRNLTSIEVNGEVWRTRYHGHGMSFSREKDNLEVNIDQQLTSPKLFSAWRLCIFLESLGVDIEHTELDKLIRSLGTQATKIDSQFWEYQNA